ncbi:MAG: hypothetical protein R3E31_04720 [Chloroflexota bacterium]|nr:hypothetical protein [Anaerolineales bacterium]MCB8989167.1 hypothetical protein [Ardenticatenaceae bacterium]
MNRDLTMQESYPQEFPALGVVSAWFGVALIGITAVLHILSTAPDATPMASLVDGLRFILMAFILASLLYLAVRASDGVSTAVLPLFINLSTFIIISFVPFAALWQEFRFNWHWQEYAQVAELVENGDLQPDVAGFAQLPWRYRHLSADGGTIMIDRQSGVTRVFFFTRRVSSWNFAGYMYRADSNPPQSGEFGGRWRQVVQKRPLWFYCVSY